jgi:FixJ family two-component response regulator
MITETTPVVIIIDDDASFRRSTERLIESAGFKVQGFAAATGFLKNHRPDVPACLVLDVRMPELSGLDLQQELAQAGVRIPIIFLTGHGDIPMSVQAMKAGAVEFLTKPFSPEALLGAIGQALKRDRDSLAEESALDGLRRNYELLTPREREVMALVVSGLLNKQIGAALGTTEKTIKFHRAHIMQKMQALSLADLVRMAGKLGVPAETSSQATNGAAGRAFQSTA